MAKRRSPRPSRSAAGPGRFSAFLLRGAQAANQSPRRRSRARPPRLAEALSAVKEQALQQSLSMTAPDPSDATRDPLTAQQDLHGLAVHDADDLLTGHVFGLLCESDTGLIRFLDVELDGKNRHVLVPV